MPLRHRTAEECHVAVGMHADLRALPAAAVEAMLLQHRRHAHTDQLHVARDGHAHVPPLRPEFALPAPPFGVADLFGGGVQATVVVAAVPDENGVAVWSVWKLVGANQIEPTQ